MQIDAAFLAVALLMLILIAFVVVVIHSLSVAAGIKVRSDMLRMLRSYDRLLESKSNEIRRLQEECEALERTRAAGQPLPKQEAETSAPAAATVSLPAAASYRTASFGSSYAAVKESFRMSEEQKDALVRQVCADGGAGGAQRGALAARLRQQLGFELVFRLSQMSADQQLELLDGSLGDEEWTLLRDYCALDGDQPFDVTKFCDWLDAIAMLETDEVAVVDGQSAASLGEDGRGAICEGIQIIAGNKLYDYSIGEREIG